MLKVSQTCFSVWPFCLYDRTASWKSQLYVIINDRGVHN
jgi:hypothetical protein